MLKSVKKMKVSVTNKAVDNHLAKLGRVKGFSTS